MTCFPDKIELRGPRHWPKLARIGLSLVAWVLLAMVFSALADAFPHGGGLFMSQDGRLDAGTGAFPPQPGLLVSAAAVVTRLMALLGSPFLALMLTHYFCASPGLLSMNKSEISAVTRRGVQISFTAPDPGSRKPLTALFQVETEAIVLEIVKNLSA